jgi:hypothetical protein
LAGLDRFFRREEATMEHIAAVLLIIGCSNDLSQCHELPAPVTIFETAEQCTAERPFALGDLAGKADRIMGECLAVDPALEEEYGAIVWDVRPDGTLDASVEIEDPLVASNAPKKTILARNE